MSKKNNANKKRKLIKLNKNVYLGLVAIGIIVIIGLVVILINSNSLESKCTRSLNICKEITLNKYDDKIKVTKIEKFDFGNADYAKEFYKTWKGPLQFDLEYALNKEENYPVVLFATILYGDANQRPVVAICRQNGELTQLTKLLLECSVN